MKARAGREYAISFLEVMCVIAVLAVLASLIIPRYVLGDATLRPKEARNQMREIMKVLERYKQDNGFYPSTKQGLKALVEKPEGEPVPLKWRKHLDKYPIDPWQNQFIYTCPGSDHGKQGDYNRDKKLGRYGYYDLTCLGADGVQDSEDDINSWNMRSE